MTATGLAGLAVIVMIGSLPALAHAQSDMDPWPLIPVHPDVPTIIHLPEDIERAWLKNPGEIILEATKRKLYIITPPDAPADLEAFISVKTRTLHRMFMVFVVERVEDAVTEVVVPPLGRPGTREGVRGRYAAKTDRE